MLSNLRAKDKKSYERGIDRVIVKCRQDATWGLVLFYMLKFAPPIVNLISAVCVFVSKDTSILIVNILFSLIDIAIKYVPSIDKFIMNKQAEKDLAKLRIRYRLDKGDDFKKLKTPEEKFDYFFEKSMEIIDRLEEENLKFFKNLKLVE